MDHQIGLPSAAVAVIPLEGVPELEETDDLGFLLHAAAELAGGLEDGDVVVVAQKAVSKVEGRVVRLRDVEPSERAKQLAGPDGDARHVEVILRESREVVRSRPPLVIAETRHGFVCASAGVDASNAPGDEIVVLLPLDPDASARGLRSRLAELSGSRRRGYRERFVRPRLAPGHDGRRARRRRDRAATRPPRHDGRPGP